MEDFKTKAKQSVLQQIMEMMDEKENSFLKTKSPKFMKVDIEATHPVEAEEMKDKLLDEVAPEMPMANPEEDEDLEKLMEMYSKLNK